MSILGIDIGTTGSKAIAFDLNGNIISSNYLEYDTVFVREGFIEIEPDTVMEKVLTVLRKTVKAVAKKDPVEVIGISCLGAVIIPVDSKGNYLYNGMSFMDSRTVSGFEKKTGMTGYDLYKITGIPPNPFFTLSKILWLKENKPDIFRADVKFFSFKELLHIKLGVTPKNDPTMASSTMMYDINKNRWSEQLFENIGIDPGFFPDVVSSSVVIGEIDSPASEEFGLDKGVKVIAGAVDTASCPMGVGVFRPGLVSNTIGTFEEAVMAVNKVRTSEDMMKKGIVYSRHLTDNSFLTQGFPTTGGHVLKWFRKQFCQFEENISQEKGTDVYDMILENIDSSDTNILFLPHLSGGGTPNIDEDSRGAFLNISASSTKDDFARAIIEGLNFEIKLSTDYFEKEFGKIGQVHVTGGAVKSDKWMQMKSDILDKDIISFKVNEAGSLGAAITAAYSAGFFKTIEEAVDNMTEVKKVFKPDRKRHGYYLGKYNTYKKLYGILKEI